MMCSDVDRYLLVSSNLWRAENQMQQRIASLRDELSKKDQALRSITGKVLHHCVTGICSGPELFTDNSTVLSDIVCLHHWTLSDAVSFVFTFHVSENCRNLPSLGTRLASSDPNSSVSSAVLCLSFTVNPHFLLILQISVLFSFASCSIFISQVFLSHMSHLLICDYTLFSFLFTSSLH